MARFWDLGLKSFGPLSALGTVPTEGEDTVSKNHPQVHVDTAHQHLDRVVRKFLAVAGGADSGSELALPTSQAGLFVPSFN